jgi:hypothetical protein
VNALIEMVFEMPEEISGQKNRNVLCQCRVIRSKETKETKEKEKQAQDKEKDREAETTLLAASIVDYKFIH